MGTEPPELIDQVLEQLNSALDKAETLGSDNPETDSVIGGMKNCGQLRQ